MPPSAVRRQSVAAYDSMPRPDSGYIDRYAAADMCRVRHDRTLIIAVFIFIFRYGATSLRLTAARDTCDDIAKPLRVAYHHLIPIRCYFFFLDAAAAPCQQHTAMRNILL